MRFARMVIMAVATTSLPTSVPAAVGAQTVPAAVGTQTVTVSSNAMVALRGPFDLPSSSLFCGGLMVRSCPEAKEAYPKSPIQPAPASQQYWGFAPTSDNTCRGLEEETSDCTLPAPNGWGVDPVGPTVIELGSVFPVAETWHWNAMTVGDFATGIGITGALHIEPPGLPAFDFPLGGLPPPGTSWDSAIQITNLDTDNQWIVLGQVEDPEELPWCDPRQRTDIPCDDIRTAKTGTYSHVAGGLTWRLHVLGFIDPGGNGEPSADLILPEVDPRPNCPFDPSGPCSQEMNKTVQPVVAPVVARLTVDTSPTATILSTEDPSVPQFSPVRLTAAVSPTPISGGTVEFRDGDDPIAGCTVQPVDATTGEATCETSSLAGGSRSLTAAYSGAIGLDSSTSQVITQFVEDTTPPDTTITSGPANGTLTEDNTLSFGFISSEPASSFECKLDRGAFVPCASPQTTSPLSNGRHTFEVRATDAAGNVDPSAAQRTFVVLPGASRYPR